MPNQTFGPTSTPQLYLENQYRLLQSQAADWERSLQSQGLNEEDYANEIGRMQEQITEQVSAFQAKAQQLTTIKGMAGITMDEEAATKANWAAVLPREVMEAMYPEQPEVSKREPFSLNEMKAVGVSVEQFAKDTPKTTLKKRYGLGGADWTKRDIRGRSQKDIMERYRGWKQFIGYEGLTPVEKRQVDGEWDAWISEKGESWKWDVTSNKSSVRAERAGGPLTRAYGSQFRQTPTGPLEATNPLQNSIARSLPKKKKQPTAEELNQNKTRENYELGKSLGYWN